MPGCGCGSGVYCCFDIQRCQDSTPFTVTTSPGNIANFFFLRIGKVIHIIGYSPSLPDGCYKILNCSFGNDTNPCPSAIFIGNPTGFDDYSTCHECFTFKASSCSSDAVVYFHASSDFIMATLLGNAINKIISTTFPGFIDQCWTITLQDAVTSIILGTYLGPFNDCPTCLGDECPDILSNISGTDDTCNQKIGSVTVTPTSGTAPYTFQWSNGTNTTGTSSTISNLSSGPYSVTITDFNGCIGTNSVVLNNLPCDKFYQISFCDTDISTFYVKNPIVTPLAADNYLCPNIYHGSITLPTSDTPVVTCFCLIPSSSGITGVSIEIDSNGYPTCFACNPPTFKLTRCDDAGIFFIVNNDLTSLVGKVIKNAVFSGCTPPSTLPCPFTPEECWSVTQEDTHVISPVSLDSYEDVFPDCPCCKPC